ncbi:MAG: lysophospholipid acyltransferase family protein [Salaquimonas sp.]
MAAKLRLIFILLILVPATLLLAPIQFIALKFFPSLARRLPIFWHRLVLRVIGVRVHIHGKIEIEKPVLLVANHVSWSDIMVLGSIQELCFIAKNEVKTWPGINWLSRLQRTVFVDRGKARDAGIQADTIAGRLIEGDTMVLFAEGTTGDGNKLLPFKSALFGAPQMALKQSGLEAIHIQPVAIAYNTLHGMPLGRYHQTYASWPGDLELMPHLLNFLRQGAFDVDVCFGESIIFDETTKRKLASEQVFQQVRRDFTRMRRLYHKA